MIFLLGLVLGALLLALVMWVRTRRIAVRWWEWLLGVLGALLATWAIHDFFASMAEHDERQGRVLLGWLGVPALILLALAVFSPWWRIHGARVKGAVKPWLRHLLKRAPRLRTGVEDIGS